MTNSEKMMASIQNQDLEHADKYFKRALQTDSEEELATLAAYLESIGFLREAKQIYLQLVPSFPEFNINLSAIASDDGDIDEAFLYLEQVDKESDFYVAALMAKASLYELEGLTDVARDKLREASQLDDDPLITYALAELDYADGQFAQAIKGYAQLDNRDILELTDVSTYQRIGVSYAHLGQFENAISFLEKALEIRYEDQIVYNLATLLFENQDYSKANLYFKQLDTLNTDFEGYEAIYAQSLHEENRIEEALKMVKKGLEKNDFDSQLMLLASQYSYELHQEKDAEEYLLKAKEISEDDETIILRLTTLYLNQGRYNEVVSFQSESIDNVLSRWNIAKAYQAIEEEGKALEIYADLASDLHHNPEFLKDYSSLLRLSGDFDKSKKYAKLYLELVPDDIEMQERYSEE